MAKEMLINVSEGEECRIALVEDGKLEELYMERTSSTSHVGNIYKGRVTNVESSIQAAFVDFGLGRNGFLHISDLMPTYFGRKGEEIQESVGRKMARRDRPPIQRCLRRGDEIIVQVIKEGIGTKGPTLSSYLSIAGRILVMMPGMQKLGVSKKIEDEEERRRLRKILDGLKPPEDVGFIIRTAGIGKSKLEIQRDFTYLTRLWSQIVKKRDSGPGPMELYTEGDLVTRTVRDVYGTDVDRVVVDNIDVAKTVKEVIKITSPRGKGRVELHDEPTPLFHKYNIEKDIEQMYSRHVPLPSGGSLVIDSTEAIVAIDVNSGKMRDHSDAETTAFRTDMEAAEEIPRQLRLRNLGGVIICDFIDLRYERHRRELIEKLADKFKHDRAKTKVLPMSQFGIVEITRSRSGASLKRSIYCDCPHCHGAGLVKTAESMSIDVMRRLAVATADLKVARVELNVHPEVAFYLQNKKRASLAHLEEETSKPIVIRTDAALGLDEVRFELFDARDGKVYLADLGMVPELPGGRRPQFQQGGGNGGSGGGGRRGRRGGRGRGGRDRDEGRRDGGGEDRYDLDRGEEAVDEREDSRELERDADVMPPPAVVSRRDVPELDDDVDELAEDVADESGEDTRDADVDDAGADDAEERGDVAVAADGGRDDEEDDDLAEGSFDEGEDEEDDERAMAPAAPMQRPPQHQQQRPPQGQQQQQQDRNRNDRRDEGRRDGGRRDGGRRDDQRNDQRGDQRRDNSGPRRDDQRNDQRRDDRGPRRDDRRDGGRPESYSNFTDTDVDLGEDDNDEFDLDPGSPTENIGNRREEYERGLRDERGMPVNRDRGRNRGGRGGRDRGGRDRQRGGMAGGSGGGGGGFAGRDRDRNRGGGGGGGGRDMRRDDRGGRPGGGGGGGGRGDQPRRQQQGPQPGPMASRPPQQQPRPMGQPQPNRGPQPVGGGIAAGGGAGGLPGEAGEGGGRRRRRRRRRRGRGGKQDQFQNGANPAGGIAPIPPGQEDVDAEMMEEGESGGADDARYDDDVPDRQDQERQLFDERSQREEDRDARGADEEPQAEARQPEPAPEPEAAPEPTPAPAAEPVAEEPAPAKKGRGRKTAAAKAPAKGRAKAGTGRGRGKKAAAASEEPAADEAAGGATSSKTARRAEITEAPAEDAGGRGGKASSSSDRHQLIVDEEPDAEEPLTPTPRPARTYRDLDEIPDDFE